MPDKDPQNYSVLAYLAFGGLSVWGGLVTYIQTVKREGRQFRWAEALLQVRGLGGCSGCVCVWVWRGVRVFGDEMGRGRKRGDEQGCAPLSARAHRPSPPPSKP